MMNIAVIFAGGVGIRMHTKAVPKQFLEVHGKPIIIYTIEKFETNKNIDGIVVVCHKDWIHYLNKILEKYKIEKVIEVVAGGKNGQESIYKGLCSVEKKYGIDDVIVLIHDGVRPMINQDIINVNIESVLKNGSAITVNSANETIITFEEAHVERIVDRSKAKLAKAPQSFWLKDIILVHRTAIKDNNLEVIDSCSLMKQYGLSLTMVEGPKNNIKITTPEDFYMFRALEDAIENEQLISGEKL